MSLPRVARGAVTLPRSLGIHAEEVHAIAGWSTNAIGHRWGTAIRVEYRKRAGRCAHAATNGYQDIDAAQARDRDAGLLVTELG